MRRTKSSITEHDREELSKFGEYLRRVSEVDRRAPGALELAYAETYGEIVFEDPTAGKALP